MPITNLEYPKIIELAHSHIIGLIISYIIGVLIMPLVIHFSEKQGLVDLPGERKIHHRPISRLGGIAIWLSTMFTLFLLIILSGAYPYKELLSGIVLGGTLMFLLGTIDDIYGLSAKFKFFIQIAIATIVFLLGVRIDSVVMFSHDPIVFGLGISYIITILWIVGISNAVNLIDGIDGLAGSVVTLSAVTLGLIAVTVGANNISSLVAFILAGSMLAFLTYNFNPAKIFMGDSGALFAGFLMATLSVTGIIQASTLAFVPLFILSVPIMDTVFSFTRRILKGKSPFVADAEHIHHKLLKLGFSQNRTVLILASLALLSGFLAIFVIGIDFDDKIINAHYLWLKYILAVVVLGVVMLLLNYIAARVQKKD